MRSGKLVAGRYLLREKVGSGPLGITLQGVDQATGQAVAVKVIERRRLARPAPASLAPTLGAEGEALVAAVAHGQDEDGWYAVRRWVDGEGLDLRRLRGPLPWEEAEALWEALAVALGGLHRRGLAHLGLSPSNVLIEQGQVRVVDAGHGQHESAGPPFRVRTAQDVELYLAPEQARGQAAGPRADVFALGALMHAMLSGVPPFRGAFPLAALGRLVLVDPPPLAHVAPDAPAWAGELLREMLDRDPARRPADGDQVRRRLGQGGRGAAPAPFGSREQRLAAVLVAGGQWVHPRPEASRQADQLAGVMRAGGLSPERLADGTVLVPLPPDRPPAAALAALGLAAAAVKAEQPTLPAALATGRGETSGRVPDGDLLERAAAMVQTEVRRGAGPNVRVDGLTAALLEGTVPGGCDDGGYLVGVTAASFGPAPGLEPEADEKTGGGDDEGGEPLDGEGSAREVALARGQARFDALPPEARRALRAASAFGPAGWREGVEHVLGQAVDWAPLIAPGRLLDRPSRYPGQREFAFADDELRLLADGSFVADEARAAHRRAAAWLQGVGAPADEVATQLGLGGDGEGLCALAGSCAEQALAQGDPAGALRWLERAEASVGDAPGTLLAMRTVALRRLGQRAQTRRAALRAIEGLTRGDAAVARMQAELLDTCGLVGDTKRLTTVVERLCRLDDPAEGVLEALAQGATAALRTGQTALAERALERVGAPAGARARGLALRARAQRANQAGYHAASLTLRRAAALQLRASGDRDLGCLADVEVALALLDAGANAEAELLVTDALGEARDEGLLEVEALGKVALGVALQRRAQIGLARATTREAVAFFGGRGNKLHEGQARLVLAALQLSSSDAAGAEREVDRALLALDPFPPSLPPALALLAQTRLAGGDIEGARHACVRARQAAPGALLDVEVALRPVLAQIAQLDGDPTEARRLLLEAEQHLLARADDFDDAARREAYLRHVPDHARTLQLARLLSILPPPPPAD